jgi:hypothetical protein
MKIVFATLLLATGFTQTAVLADGNTGIVRGIVVQYNGKPIRGALVSWENPSGMGSVRTNDEGAFYFFNVIPGRTEIRLAQSGFSTRCLRGSVHANETVDAVVKLYPYMTTGTGLRCQPLHKTAREAVEDSR